MKKLTIGIVAHVDAGKTTLSEQLLYLGGTIRRTGRVDHGDTFFDSNAMERSRGITIFSKQANMHWQDLELTLLDTPGHVDFSAEMERTLQVLDYGILVLSGSDGVQSHTETLWKLLKRYEIPTFVFVNKMDIAQKGKEELLEDLQRRLGDGFVDFTLEKNGEFYEEVAMLAEDSLEEYMETGSVKVETIGSLLQQRTLFPVYFGSALKGFGIEELLSDIQQFAKEKSWNREAPFGAKIFKISTDKQGKRQTHLRVTSGRMIPKMTIGEEKVDQLRNYNGEKFELLEEAVAGDVVVVTGITEKMPGEALGAEKDSVSPLLNPVLQYQVLVPSEVTLQTAYEDLKKLAEEAPELQVTWREDTKELMVHLMGEVQTEVLSQLVKDRFNYNIAYGPGSVQYKETIENVVEGVGHFEPLRHYAEVHLRLEPGEPGSGMQFFSDCSVDMLALNWQRLILTHLEERQHVGVLTGSPITDMKITVVGGRAHNKHTEGGDFRQATYRAVRQGLKKAKNVLLEPYYRYELEIPTENLGRAMQDIQEMAGSFETPEQTLECSILKGLAPISTMNGYHKEVTAYTGGKGRLTLQPEGYGPCHNEDEVIARIGYDSEMDLENPTSSVFCAHGAGFQVSWDQVEQYMHVESMEAGEETLDTSNLLAVPKRAKAVSYGGTLEEDKELQEIFEKHFGKVKKSFAEDAYENMPKVHVEATGKTTEEYKKKQAEKKKPQKEYLLVDGYNVIHAWDDLRELAQDSLDAARGKLMDYLCNYQGYRGCELILVFDAYKVKGGREHTFDYHNIHVVYTKEAETADMYIEKTTHDIAKDHHVTVATSDGLEQIIVLGEGASRMSSRELELAVKGDSLF